MPVSVNNEIPAKTVERLVVYRRLLQKLAEQGEQYVHSREISEMANNSAAQVRRDLMIIGYSGSPAKGYDVNELIKRINRVFEKKGGQKVALVGIGKLGRALLAYFSLRQPRLKIVAAFDNDPGKVNKETHGCPCYHIDEMTRVISEAGATVGIITVPAQDAQHAADLMLMAGVTGILNFAPTRLKVPAHAVVDDVDIATKLEKVAFFCD